MDLMQVFLSVLAAIFVGWFLWFMLRPQCAFVVRLDHGVPKLVQGTVSQAFVLDVADICTRHGVNDCVVRGVKRRDRISLAFSDGMPAACRQQLRNLWTMSAGKHGPAARRRVGPARH
jgi:hypothetical protein